MAYKVAWLDLSTVALHLLQMLWLHWHIGKGHLAECPHSETITVLLRHSAEQFVYFSGKKTKGYITKQDYLSNIITENALKYYYPEPSCSPLCWLPVFKIISLNILLLADEWLEMHHIYYNIHLWSAATIWNIQIPPVVSGGFCFLSQKSELTRNRKCSVLMQHIQYLEESPREPQVSWNCHFTVNPTWGLFFSFLPLMKSQ